MVDPAPEGTQPNPQPDFAKAREAMVILESFAIESPHDREYTAPARQIIRDTLAISERGLLERTALARRIQTLQAEIAQLQQRVIPEGARADTERLDWLEGMGHFGYKIGTKMADMWVAEFGNCQERTTLRAAIDTARSVVPETGEPTHG